MENNSSEAKPWGGRREGAGRKKTAVRAVGFNAPQDVADILEEAVASGISRTEYILAAIRYYHQHNDK